MAEFIGSLVIGFGCGVAIAFVLICLFEAALALGRGIRRVWWWAAEMVEIAYYHLTHKS